MSFCSSDRSRVVRGARVTVVAAGSNFQKALNAAEPGDTLVLEAGATFNGPFTLPRKSGKGWIVIQSSALERLPRAGLRVNPSHSALMPVLESASAPVLNTEPGAHHYRFIGLEIRPTPGAFLYNLILLGADERSLDELPDHIVFERCYIHGDPQRGTRRGIAMNSRSTAVLDSYLADFKEIGADSQAVASWNGSGPFAIVNNYLEAAGENVMFGGADPSISGLIPSDIEIRKNYFFKPLSWRIGDRTYAGTPWTVKNLFELKSARRVLVDGNIFEHNWPQAQNGFSILFTVRDQNGTAPWSVVEDVTFTHNVVRHIANGVNILGTDDLYPSAQTKRIHIKDNLFEDVNGLTWGGNGRLLQILRGALNVDFDHNTVFGSGDLLILAAGDPDLGFVYTNNIAPHGQFGVAGDNTAGNPRLTLTTYFPGAGFTRNVLVGAAPPYPPLYPANNFFPPMMADVLFEDLAGGDYRLQSSSPYKHAGTDGKDVGVDFDALIAAQSGSGSRPPWIDDGLSRPPSMSHSDVRQSRSKAVSARAPEFGKNSRHY